MRKVKVIIRNERVSFIIIIIAAVAVVIKEI